jgi:hypothetical protein
VPYEDAARFQHRQPRGGSAICVTLHFPRSEWKLVTRRFTQLQRLTLSAPLLEELDIRTEALLGSDSLPATLATLNGISQTRKRRALASSAPSAAFEVLFLQFKYRAEGGDFAPDKHGWTRVVTGPARSRTHLTKQAQNALVAAKDRLDVDKAQLDSTPACRCRSCRCRLRLC